MIQEAQKQEDKAYSDLVGQGAAMERLLENPEWQEWLKLLDQEKELVLQKIAAASLDALPGLQGALLELLRIRNIADKKLRAAKQAVEARRMESEG